MTAKRRWFAFALVALMVGVASHSHAQDYPSRFIRVIVGPGPDITARVFGAKITEVLGQQVVVEPRPGAGGTIAAQAVAGAPGDGYTLLLASASYTINTAMGQSPLDLGRDFAPIALVATVPFVLVVHPALAAKSLAELIALAKANPGKLNYASSGIGTPPHLAGELFKSMAGIDVVHVPFREANAALNAVVGGSVEMMFSIASTAVAQIERGYGARHRGHLALRLAPRSRPAGDGGSGACRLFGAGMERIGRAQGNAAGDHRKAQFGRATRPRRRRAAPAARGGGLRAGRAQFARRLRALHPRRHGEMGGAGGTDQDEGSVTAQLEAPRRGPHR